MDRFKEKAQEICDECECFWTEHASTAHDKTKEELLSFIAEALRDEAKIDWPSDDELKAARAFVVSKIKSDKREDPNHLVGYGEVFTWGVLWLKERLEKKCT